MKLFAFASLPRLGSLPAFATERRNGRGASLRTSSIAPTIWNVPAWLAREAERRARIEFGGYERFKEESHEALGGNFFETLLQDVRFGSRIL